MASSLSLTEYLRNITGIILFVIAFLIIIPIIFVLVLLTWGKATNWIVEHFAPAIAIPVLWVLGIKFKKNVIGEPFSEPAIYIINHSSTLDIPTMMAVGLPKARFVAKWELQYIPFFWAVGRLTGQVFIKRQNSEEAVKTLQKTYERVKRDKLNIMLAPEGSRKHPGIIGPFKKGAFRMAIDLGYPIVPIYFDGNRELSLGGSILAKSGEITAHIHPPVDTSSWTKENLDQHIADVRSMYLEWAGVKEDIGVQTGTRN